MIKKKQANPTKRASLERGMSPAASLQPNAKNDSKNRLSKEKQKNSKHQKDNRHVRHPERSKSRGPIQQNCKDARKSKNEVDEIHMKKDLKLLISKKVIRKSKDEQIVPEILKKIQQNCRILRKIDHQQRHASNKRASKQSISGSKSFKQNCFNNKSELPFNKSTGKSKEVHPQQPKLVQKSRQSQQISKEHRKSEKTQGKMISIQKPLQSQKKNPETQQYKEMIAQGQIRVEKSSKNTNYNSNYNSNQSKNSSSLHNSRGLFSIHQLLSKQHKLEENSALDRIQGLIKQQQNHLELSRSQKPHLETESLQKSSRLKYSEIQQQKQYLIIANQNEEKNSLHRTKKSNHLASIQPKQIKESFDEQLLNNASSLQQKSRSIHQFQKSKYYVQPIPPFKGKSQMEDSLVGCQITLIENNIINDSELPELQL